MSLRNPTIAWSPDTLVGAWTTAATTAHATVTSD